MNSKEKTKYRTTKKWKNFRMYLIKKQCHTCELCGIKKIGKATKYLQIHHLNPEAYGHEKESDVVVLCSSHHRMLENLLSRKEFDIDDFCIKLKDLYIRSKK